MRPSPGTACVPVCVSSEISPPSTIIWPSSTSTCDSSERLLRMMPLGFCALKMLDTSW